MLKLASKSLFLIRAQKEQQQNKYPYDLNSFVYVLLPDKSVLN